MNDALDHVMRHDRGRLLAALSAQLRDIDLAEEALSEAMISATEHWQRGVPDNPAGWLMRVARRKAIDRIRRAGRFAARVPDLEMLAQADQDDAGKDAQDIPDERLRLIFTCCHPALELKSRVALTLRTLGGLSTPEIARAFLDRESTMGQRLSRAKSKITKAGIPFSIPGPQDWPERLNSVLTVVYLIFNEGYGATKGADLVRRDLCEEAIYLARMLGQLAPNTPEVMALLSLMLTTHARREARLATDGRLIALNAQDRCFWDSAMIYEGLGLLGDAMAQNAPGPFQIKAAISALHVEAKTYAQTDWHQIEMLYAALYRFEPSPVVELNRCVALAETGELSQARELLAVLANELEAYQPFHAAQADLARRAGDVTAARQSYDRAIELSGTRAEQTFLQARRDELAQN